jgi:polysaccharide pyruvyl transferase WcaK-like protein
MRIIIKKFLKFYKSAYKMGHFPGFFEIFYTNKKVFAYYGYLGDNNFGDELVFEAAKKIFEPNILLPVRKFMPLSLKVFCFLFKSKFAGVVIGGGTLIGPFWEQQFFLSLMKLNKKVYVHGTGVHKHIDCPKEWAQVFSNDVYGGVRGYLSKDNLAPIYPNVKIMGDAAFAFFEKAHWDQHNGERKSILINIGTHFSYEGEDFSRNELRKFIKSVIGEGYTVKFLPLHLIDNKLGIKLKSEFPDIVLLDQPDNFINALHLFQDCSFAVGERLHFTVMAVLGKIPFVSLNYGKKHEDLLNSVELSHAGLIPEKFSLDILNDLFYSRSTFNWGSAENTIASLKDFQITEAAAFLEKH